MKDRTSKVTSWKWFILYLIGFYTVWYCRIFDFVQNGMHCIASSYILTIYVAYVLLKAVSICRMLLFIPLSEWNLVVNSSISARSRTFATICLTPMVTAMAYSTSLHLIIYIIRQTRIWNAIILSANSKTSPDGSNNWILLLMHSFSFYFSWTMQPFKSTKMAIMVLIWILNHR